MNKIIPIFFFLVVCGLGFLCYNYSTQNTTLKSKNLDLNKQVETVTQEKKRLWDENRLITKEKSQLKEDKEKISAELSRIQMERDTLNQKFTQLTEERDLLVEKLKSKPKVAVVEKSASTQMGQTYAGNEGSEEYWVDFVRAKADLEVQLETLRKELLDSKTDIAELTKLNKEFGIKIDELSKEKERLTDAIKIKERTLSIMSRDLVAERESRKTAILELDKLRGDNVGLKREILVVNADKKNLQMKLKEIISKKESLETRISEIDNILRDKSMALDELQDDLKYAIKGGKMVNSNSSVELPPIVIKPEIVGLKGLRGEILAVNMNENFVVMDLGETTGVRPGMKFSVLRGTKEIATIDVIEVRKDIAAADISSIVGNYSIQEGDIVSCK
ncbi:MAG: hypothetical protein PHP69_02090 [Candidatus Omnitrophica bacterium]|nr:hypothetical protein [Candidatus Omnitrophota bacterium]MDD5080830.1 hypothetical protein [Candidatus Omnitrophota bacterium]MDD5441200.1 hypothetical protein [Candidatus Omnitrophota bacterium]